MDHSAGLAEAARRGTKRVGRKATAAIGLDVKRLPRSVNSSPLTMSVEFVAAHRMLTKPALVFVQIGAFDGLANDPLHDLIVAHGWRGVLVEPQPRYFAQLQETYAGVDGLTFLNAAVAHEPGPKTLYTVREEPGLPDWAPQIASFDRENVLGHAVKFPAIGAAMEEQRVDGITIADVFAHAPGDVDLIQIDVEGFDAEVVRMLDLATAPPIIRFEHKHLARADRDDCVARLVAAGYQVAFEYEDTLAYRRI
jgi:FkbM family methyltransferase